MTIERASENGFQAPRPTSAADSADAKSYCRRRRIGASTELRFLHSIFAELTGRSRQLHNDTEGLGTGNSAGGTP